MSFQTNGYQIIRKVISKELSDFVCNYFLLKRRVARKFFDDKRILPCTKEWGFWTDRQVPNTYSHYADIAMEILLEKVQPVMEEKSGVKLVPNYSYARIYKKGDVLERHQDRPSCEISTTLHLGGEPWAFYLEPDLQIDLGIGDMLMYRGCEIEHWRDAFEGEACVQVFLHYNDASKSNSMDKIYDSRPFLGLPHFYRNL